jgi:pimeloyl-ACP methyl ester carboxylesterase
MPSLRIVPIIAATALLTSVTPANAASDPLAPYLTQQISWGDCAFDLTEGSKPAECALITVPRDWANPTSGTDLRVSISRVAAIGHRTGAILVNPGGPGGQGTSLAGSLAGLEPSVNALYDFIGMDPRGTGQEGTTDHGFVCEVPTERIPTGLDARDRSAQSIALHQQIPRAIAEACQSDALAPYITTWQTAHDMDLIRALLGDEKLNYLGYSYGTWLGAKYASLFPEHAGKTVLDSSMNFEGRLQADFEAFPVIDQRQFDDVYLPWVARRYADPLGKTAADVKVTWERVREFYKTHGIDADSYDTVFVGNGNEFQWYIGVLLMTLAVNSMDSGGTAAPGEELDSVSREAFGVPAAQLTVADVAETLPKLESDYTRITGTRYAVACGDQPTMPAAWYKRLSDRQGPEYPLFGWNYGLSEVCGFWSDAPRHELPNLTPEAAKNVLVVQGEFDPQTGYEQAKAAARAAGVPLVSVEDSPFHGQYAIDGNPCVDGLVNTFLVKNSRPGSTTCPGIPLPDEDVVHPVSGPIGGKHEAATTRTGDRLSGLRTEVRKTLGDLDW